MKVINKEELEEKLALLKEIKEENEKWDGYNLVYYSDNENSCGPRFDKNDLDYLGLSLYGVDVWETFSYKGDEFFRTTSDIYDQYDNPEEDELLQMYVDDANDNKVDMTVEGLRTKYPNYTDIKIYYAENVERANKIAGHYYEENEKDIEALRTKLEEEIKTLEKEEVVDKYYNFDALFSGIKMLREGHEDSMLTDYMFLMIALQDVCTTEEYDALTVRLLDYIETFRKIAENEYSVRKVEPVEEEVVEVA